MMPILGFFPADDPRMLATTDVMADRITDDRADQTALGAPTGSGDKLGG
jgi:GH15 family glucan-1,4-alpha-glucosidase